MARFRAFLFWLKRYKASGGLYLVTFIEISYITTPKRHNTQPKLNTMPKQTINKLYQFKCGLRATKFPFNAVMGKSENCIKSGLSIVHIGE